jgi:hypothetical protein
MSCNPLKVNRHLGGIFRLHLYAGFLLGLFSSEAGLSARFNDVMKHPIGRHLIIKINYLNDNLSNIRKAYGSNFCKSNGDIELCSILPYG